MIYSSPVTDRAGINKHYTAKQTPWKFFKAATVFDPEIYKQSRVDFGSADVAHDSAQYKTVL
jgi:hypothetical protein